MKQHDLLVLLCEVHPHAFTITISFKDKAVYVDTEKPKWHKVIPYDTYKEQDTQYLAKEILDEYSKARTTKKVLRVS